MSVKQRLDGAEGLEEGCVLTIRREGRGGREGSWDEERCRKRKNSESSRKRIRRGSVDGVLSG